MLTDINEITAKCRELDSARLLSYHRDYSARASREYIHHQDSDRYKDLNRILTAIEAELLVRIH